MRSEQGAELGTVVVRASVVGGVVVAAEIELTGRDERGGSVFRVDVEAVEAVEGGGGACEGGDGRDDAQPATVHPASVSTTSPTVRNRGVIEPRGIS